MPALILFVGLGTLLLNVISLGTYPTDIAPALIVPVAAAPSGATCATASVTVEPAVCLVTNKVLLVKSIF